MNSEKLIISLYDYTGSWPKPYIEAGYPVILWDKKCEGDIVSEEFFKMIERYSDSVYGILSATPCTYFSVSGARWWPRIPKDDLSEMVGLAELVLILKDMCPNLKFWAQENPAGRIEQLIPELKPYRKLSFNPCDYGDPYIKRTILWGEFNANLKQTPVLPIFKDYIKNMPGDKNQAEKRSATPPGFAQAFFEANQ